MTGPTSHKNLQLVRQLLEIWLESPRMGCATGNERMLGLFYKETGGDECLFFLDDVSDDRAADVLREVLQLAIEPAPAVITGRDRESKRMQAQYQRDEIALYVRVALALLEVENAPKPVAGSISPAPQSTALPDSVPELMRTMAIQMTRGSGSTARSRPLWSKPFPSLGHVDNLVLKLRPDLALEISNSSSGQVLMQTEPVDFGPLAQNSKTVEEKFEAWCQMRNRDLAAPYLAPGDEKPSAEGNEA